MRGQTRRFRGESSPLAAALVGLLFLITGFSAGYIVTGMLDEAQMQNYIQVTQTAVSTVIAGGQADSAVTVALLQSFITYGLMVLGAAWWMLTPFSIIFYTLSLFPFGCALSLLFAVGGPAVLCGILCVALPGLCFCAVYVQAWVKMAKGARNSLHNLPAKPVVVNMLLNGLWLIPCCLFQGALAPLLFRWLVGVFW